MRAIRLLVVVFVLVGGLLVSGDAFAAQGTSEKHFVPGGRVRLNLSAGDYTIKAGREDRIFVSWETPGGETARVAIGADTTSKDATIATNGPHNNFRVTIELPARADLHIDLSAGNIRVEKIIGNKDIGSWAGNIDVDVPRPDEYKLVDLSVRAGNIKADHMGISKDGLFRSYRWTGKGPYTLRVKLTAGNVRLIPA